MLVRQPQFAERFLAMRRAWAFPLRRRGNDHSSEQLPNKLHGFSTDAMVVFAFRSVLNSTEEDSESS
jgi:hypothetical protein